MNVKIVGHLHLTTLFKLTFCIIVLFSLSVCTGTQSSIVQSAAAVDEQKSIYTPNWDKLGPVKQTHYSEDFRIYWLPFTGDAAYLHKVIASAQVYQVKGFCFSDEQWPLPAQNDANPQWQDVLLPLVTEAQAVQQEIWYALHEPVPRWDEENLTREESYQQQLLLIEAFKEKYSRLVQEVLPGLNGVIINFTEPLEPEVRTGFAGQPLQALVSLVRNGVLPAQAFVALRYPAAAPASPAETGKALAGLQTDVIIINRAVPGDDYPFYPPEPALESFDGKEQWVEFDLGLGNQGENILPYADPQFYLTQLRMLKERGINTVCLRLDKGLGQKGKNALDTPWGQLNLAVFTAFKQHPQITAEEIITAWEKEQFPGAYKILQLTTAMVRRAFFPKKLRYAADSTLPDFEELTALLTEGVGRQAAWSGATAEDRALAAKPTLAWLKEIQAEDMASLADLNTLEMTLGEKHVNIFLYNVWKEGLKALKIYVELFRLHKQAYFAIRLYQTDPTAISREQVRAYLREFDSLVTFFSPLPDYARVRANVPLSKILASLRHGLEATP
jgi:hypothetical protein